MDVFMEGISLLPAELLLVGRSASWHCLSLCCHRGIHNVLSWPFKSGRGAKRVKGSGYQHGLVTCSWLVYSSMIKSLQPSVYFFVFIIWRFHSLSFYHFFSSLLALPFENNTFIKQYLALGSDRFFMHSSEPLKVFFVCIESNYLTHIPPLNQIHFFMFSFNCQECQ